MKNHVPLILALEPDQRQAAILKRMIRDRVHAELIVVDSRDGAVAAVDARVPDVILLTALLSPRDEAEILSHLRTRDGAEHVQTHTIPQLASSSQDGEVAEPRGGLLGKLRRKKAAEPIPGCDPSAFADEVGTFIERAAEMRVITSAPSAHHPTSAAGHAPAAAAHGHDGSAEPEPEPDPSSAWSSPFEWRRADAPVQRAEPAGGPPVVRQPLVTASPLAVIAEEKEQRLAGELEREQETANRERARLEAEASVQRDRQRLDAEAAAKRERERVEAEAAATRERERLEAEASAKRERQRLETEAAAKRERERVEAEAAAKRERQRLEAEAAAKRERARLEAEAAAKRERERVAAEAAAKRERARLEAEVAAKRERERVEAEAAAKRERARLEAEAAAKRERERLEAEAAAKRERARLEAEAAAKRERERLEAEAAAKREHARLEAEAAAKREHARLEAEAAAKREHARLEAEAAAKREHARLEAEAAARREHARLEAEADARREHARLEAEADARREHERLEAEAAATLQRERLEAEAAAERMRLEAAAAVERARLESDHGAVEYEIDLDNDPFADFRPDAEDRRQPLLTLMPLAQWAKLQEPRQPKQDAAREDDLRDLMEGLALPPNVAKVTYARGCRIRRVRVPAARVAKPRSRNAKTVIVSKRALEEAREENRTGR